MYVFTIDPKTVQHQDQPSMCILCQLAFSRLEETTIATLYPPALSACLLHRAKNLLDLNVRERRQLLSTRQIDAMLTSTSPGPRFVNIAVERRIRGSMLPRSPALTRYSMMRLHLCLPCRDQRHAHDIPSDWLVKSSSVKTLPRRNGYSRLSSVPGTFVGGQSR